MNPRQRALEVLCLADPGAKAAQARALFDALMLDAIDPRAEFVAPPGLPGRPPLPLLVAPTQVPARSPFTPAGRAALLHAIAHIEFNAINLALDVVWRFAGMPREFYRDWLRVASEEALHFGLLREHLRTIDSPPAHFDRSPPRGRSDGLGAAQRRLGYDYGDFDAHDGLWAMAERTAGDVVARMALVPRTLEARGLDATPPLQVKFARAGDARAVEILGIILRDEVGHVAIGNHWYRWLCARDGLDAEAHYPQLARRYAAPRLRAPFNLEARRAAGFSEAELDALQQRG